MKGFLPLNTIKIAFCRSSVLHKLRYKYLLHQIWVEGWLWQIRACLSSARCTTFPDQVLWSHQLQNNKHAKITSKSSLHVQNTQQYTGHQSPYHRGIGTVNLRLWQIIKQTSVIPNTVLFKLFCALCKNA